ncbi:hypothetical protein SMACR_08370 [Sordaria macrospora]|uniref:WGS project CABT00000000 data, contig 2.28 n=2 Tax=Sordaria macrospora TaxID=5147 RepID=F7W4T7_SORMK|nr:uncharacterized protein SMAC_08370 [Sordaria macrospora k-hell]KAA8631387.1 hypothetical protein SMACR_08370 [Sordaria macrospora]WPJ60174.1 hypothetical protein SMAC4_08370 [Sordaria macrospora]CCC12524.1 unnamed protein product [Sordaria macrospora k-hell]
MAAVAGAGVALLPFGALISIVLLGTFTVSVTVAFLGIWLSRRRRLATSAKANNNNSKERSGGACHHDLTGETTIAGAVASMEIGKPKEVAETSVCVVDEGVGFEV